MKSVTGNWDCPPPGPAIILTNCVFSDGNASALNFSFSHVVDHCAFYNLDMVEEFYQGYATNASIFQYCIVSNMAGALISLNGALSNAVNPPYVIQSNLFYVTGNGIQTTPAQNVVISGNTFIGPSGGGTAVILGCAGYQGSTINSNILVQFNTMSNVYYGFSVQGGGNNRVENVQVVSNRFWGANGTSIFATGYGWSTNVIMRGNAATHCWAAIHYTGALGQWYSDDPSNVFPPFDNFYTVETNLITYANGRRQKISESRTNSVWVLNDSRPARIPGGEVLQITSTATSPVTIYSSTNMLVAAIILTNSQTAAYQWMNGRWQYVGNLAPPSNMRLSGH